MKATFAVILILSLLLPGCTDQEELRTAEFYYPRSTYTQDSMDSVIAPEERNRENLSTITLLLDQYLQGPLDEELCSPFPPECKLLTMSNKDRTVTLVLSESFADLSGLDRSLAYACLGYTCANLDTIETMHILVLNETKQVILDETISIPSLLPPEVTPSTEANQ